MQKPAPRKILVIRLSSIGDILLTTPLLRLLPQRFPQAQIDFCIKERYAELLQAHPGLRQLLILEENRGWPGLVRLRRRIRSEKYDLIVDVHKNFRSMILADRRAKIVRYRKYYFKRWLLVHVHCNLFKQGVPVYRRYLDSVHIEDDGRYLDFFLSQSEKDSARNELQSRAGAGRLKRIGFAVGAGYETKQWPVDYFVSLAKLLLEQESMRIFIFGAEKDRPFADAIAGAAGEAAVHLCGQLTLRQTAAWIAEMDLMVTHDSGLMHLATAMKIPTLAIFGSTTRELGFFPEPPLGHVLEHPHLACRPCSHVGRHRCPKDHFRCMKEITPEAVAQRIYEMLHLQTSNRRNETCKADN